MRIVPGGLGEGILVDDDGEAIDLATGYEARHVPDGVTLFGQVMTDVWIIGPKKEA